MPAVALVDTLREATATADAECINLPGLTQESAMPEGCRALLQVSSATSGFYWVRFGSVRHEVYCDMTTDGVS